MHKVPSATLVAFEVDESGWLESTAELLRQGRLTEIDVPALAEYLTDMAQRDRREVVSRLVILLAHLLKWENQPDRQSRSWLVTILEQQRELLTLLESGTLRRHAEAELADAYLDARKHAAAETGLPRAAFPPLCPWDLNELFHDRGESAPHDVP